MGMILFFSILLGASSLPIVALYPFMKRYTYWPQSVLGESVRTRAARSLLDVPVRSGF